jgi:hypothetical protein
MKAINGLDYIRDSNWKPKEFISIQSIINYAKRVMPRDLKEHNFQVATFVGDDYVRFSYGRKC